MNIVNKYFTIDVSCRDPIYQDRCYNIRIVSTNRLNYLHIELHPLVYSIGGHIALIDGFLQIELRCWLVIFINIRLFKDKLNER
jgi:hypothetical protein